MTSPPNPLSTMERGSKTAAVVLLGGRSSRMGRPKAELPLAGRPFLLHVVDALGDAVGLSNVVAVVAPDAPAPDLPPGVRVARDRLPDRGPLEGLAAGLLALGGGVDSVFLAACDAPLLTPAFARHLLAAGPELCVVPDALGFRHPLAAAYKPGVLPTLLTMLDAGLSRPAELFARVPTRFVTEAELRAADPDLDSLRNVNTPADYAALVAG